MAGGFGSNLYTPLTLKPLRIILATLKALENCLNNKWLRNKIQSRTITKHL